MHYIRSGFALLLQLHTTFVKEIMQIKLHLQIIKVLINVFQITKKNLKEKEIFYIINISTQLKKSPLLYKH